MQSNIPDVVTIIAVGTILFLLMGMFIAFMTLAYQGKRRQHHKEVKGIIEVYQKEILKAKLEMQEQTFQYIAQEIHDNVGQLLALVKLNLSMIGKHEGISNEQKIQSSEELLAQAIEELRNLSKQLNCTYVSQQSLTELISFQLGLLQKTGAVNTNLQVRGGERSFDPEKKLIVFRIVQEALSNIIKHAAANSIAVKLISSIEKVTLTISDDGKGFTLPEQNIQKALNGTGVANMYFRAALIGAVLYINSKPGIGTVVILEIPLN